MVLRIELPPIAAESSVFIPSSPTRYHNSVEPIRDESETIGARKSASRPSAHAIWSARRNALLMRCTTAGTELAGYSD